MNGKITFSQKLINPSLYHTGLEIAINTVAKATNFFSFVTKKFRLVPKSLRVLFERKTGIFFF